MLGTLRNLKQLKREADHLAPFQSALDHTLQGMEVIIGGFNNSVIIYWSIIPLANQ